MSDKAYVEVKVRLIIRKDEDANITEILENMDYSFKDTTGTADINETEILEWDVTDLK